MEKEQSESKIVYQIVCRTFWGGIDGQRRGRQLVGEPHDSPEVAREFLAKKFEEHRARGNEVDENAGTAEWHTADNDQYYRYEIFSMEKIDLTE